MRIPAGSLRAGTTVGGDKAISFLISQGNLKRGRVGIHMQMICSFCYTLRTVQYSRIQGDSLIARNSRHSFPLPEDASSPRAGFVCSIPLSFQGSWGSVNVIGGNISSVPCPTIPLAWPVQTSPNIPATQMQCPRLFFAARWQKDRWCFWRASLIVAIAQASMSPRAR